MSTTVELREVATAIDIPQSEATRRSRTVTEPVDDVVESSRLADSTVPDGGYGWVVIAGCAIMTFWVCRCSRHYSP